MKAERWLENQADFASFEWQAAADKAVTAAH